jgi:Leucine-rich repeat (LRR) protein
VIKDIEIGSEQEKLFKKMTEMDKLSSVKLIRCCLDSFAPQAKLFNVKEIELDGNQICKLPVGVFRVPTLVRLSLQDNRLKEVPFTAFDGSQSRLKVLNLSRNQIKLSGACEKFVIFTDLEDLDLSSNQLDTIPTGISNLLRLQSLRLINNQIHEIPVTFLTSEHMIENLQCFILNGNPL